MINFLYYVFFIGLAIFAAEVMRYSIRHQQSAAAVISFVVFLICMAATTISYSEWTPVAWMMAKFYLKGIAEILL